MTSQNAYDFVYNFHVICGLSKVMPPLWDLFEVSV